MRTVGVEEELLLVDAHSGRPRAVAGQVLRSAEQERERDDPTGASEEGGSLDHEVQQQQLETDTRPHTSMADLETELCEWRARAGHSAREAGARVLAVGTSPMPVEPSLLQTERFTEMAERFGQTLTEQLTCGCHVHVAVESDDEAIGVLDRMRVWLPALLAVSGNSPYWQGRDTGYASFRSQVLGRWPTSGPPEVHGSAAAWREHVQRLLDAEIGLDEGMLYADARPSHTWPTVEVRVADVCADVRDTVLLAALSRALVDTEARAWAAGEPVPEVPQSLLRVATWQAGREGSEGRLLDPLTGRPRPAVAVLDALLEHVAEALRANGDEDLVRERFEAVLTHGTGAARQRAVMEKTGELLDVVATIARTTAGQGD